VTDLSHLTKIDVVDVAAAVDADKLTEADVFKRTYLGHGLAVERLRLPGPRRTVPEARPRRPRRDRLRAGRDRLGDGRRRDPAGRERRRLGDPDEHAHGGQFEDAPQVLFISSPIDDPNNQDRVWLDE